jgi:type IV secretion system protein VirB10
MTMTETPPAGAPQAKAPPPTLSLRAAGPRAIRLRKRVVQIAVVGACGLLSGALAWAFVVQPELRQAARERAATEGAEPRGAVRPADVVTAQPASYDRLPPPRTARPDATEPPAVPEVTPPRTVPRRETSPTPAGPRPLDLARSSGLFFAAASPSAPQARGAAQTSGAEAADLAATYNGHVLTDPLSPFELKAGALVPAVLLTAVDTARAGPVVAAVTEPVYDTVSGRFLLLPQGTRLIGRHDGESAYGDRRAFITWNRLILPNGKSLVLTGEPGVDAEGAVGVRGEVDRRLVPLAVATLFAGAITTLGQAARDDDDRSGGLLGDAGDAAAIEGARVGGRLIDRELEVRPTIRLRPGERVRVLITRDLILEPFAP